MCIKSIEIVQSRPKDQKRVTLDGKTRLVLKQEFEALDMLLHISFCLLLSTFFEICYLFQGLFVRLVCPLVCPKPN